MQMQYRYLSHDIFFLMGFFPFLQTENSKVEEKQKAQEQEITKFKEENDKNILEIAALKQELEIAKTIHDRRSLEMETEAKGAKAGLQMRLKELECLLADSNNKVKELEASSESKCQRWNMKENTYQSFMDFQFGAMRVYIGFYLYYFCILLFNIIHFTNLFKYSGIKVNFPLHQARNFKNTGELF